MIKRPLSLNAAIKQYERESARAKVELAEQQRADMLQRFPRDHWRDMTLNEYALGQGEYPENFCRYIEYWTQELGRIGGGFAAKHLIYKRKENQGWYFPKEFKNEKHAWKSLRGQFTQAFDYAETGRWEEIEHLPLLSRGSMVRLKALHLYYPENIIPVYSKTHLQHFLSCLGGEADTSSSIDALSLNREILGRLRDIPELETWSTKEYEQFLYWWRDPRVPHKVVKIAPGKNARYWEECLRGGYICAGWDEVGDLNQFESKTAYRNRFLRVYLERDYKSNRLTATRKSTELWMLKELVPGDLVVANHGISKVLGLGKVIEPGYQWREGREMFKHTVNVEWYTQYSGSIPAQKDWENVTVKKVSEKLLQIVSNLNEGLDPSPIEAVVVDPIYHRIDAALERKGQVILYGPPGTGKTYTARRFAVWWLMCKSNEAEANAVLGDKRRLEAGERKLSTAQIVPRVWWAVKDRIPWSWVDGLPLARLRLQFESGRLRKNFVSVQRGDLVIGYQTAPDRKITFLARVSEGLRSIEGQSPYISIEPVAQVENGLTYHELLSDSVLSRSEPSRLRCQGKLFALTSSEAERLISLLIERDPRLSFEDDDPMGEVGQLTRVTFHPAYTYEDFIEGYRPSEAAGDGLSLHLEDGIFKRVCRTAQVNPGRHYVILVDEINRGNVAKILGEVLTVVERDKRGLTVFLPQSKEAFSIPPNVYVLGTMNTADRSIKLLDAALRRRFAFLELMPDLELLSGAMVGDLALDVFLQELNRRIARSEGREKQIGHAYLLDRGDPVSDVESFARCFREDILPLLQEYCYDEYGTLAKFIGNGLVDAESESLDDEKVADADGLVEALTQEFGGEARPGVE